MPTITHDQNELWRYDHDLQPLQDRIESYRIISLDIFDTLLFRAVREPAEVFERTADKAIARGMFRRSIHAKEFRAIRIQAERSARSRMEPYGHSETTLEAIYNEIPSSLLDREEVLKLELDTEQELCYLNPNIASLLRFCRARGCQVALVSDMYLSSAQMLDLLSSAGLDPSWIDRLLISSEQQGGKADGRLFDRLCAAFPDAAIHEIVHIGDNYYADIKGAASRGIAAVHYTVVPDSFASPFHWEHVRHGADLPEINSLRKLASQTLPDRPLDEAALAYYRFGAGILGPFLHALCEWAVDMCVRERYPAIHPLMREAHVLAPMLRHIIQRRGLKIDVFPIHISRQAAFLPSLECFGEAELAYLMQLNWVKVKDLFVILDIEPQLEPFRQHEDKLIRDCELIMDDAGVSIAERLKSYLLRDEFKRKIEARCLEQRRLFMKYLEQTCGASTNPIVTLDIGFNGTIQKSMQHIAQLAGNPLPMVHLLAVGTERTADMLRSGVDLRCYVGSPGHGMDVAKRIARSPAFLEELMMGRLGSTLKYAEDEKGIVQTVTAALAHEESEFLYKEACQLGIGIFQQYCDYFTRQKPGLLPDPSVHRREWCLPLHRAIDMPSPGEVRMLGSLTHQDNFCGTRIAAICEPIEDNWFAHGGSHFLDLCNYGPSVFNANWPQGLLTGQDPYYLYRYYLRAGDQFGRQVLLFDMVQRLKRADVRSVNIYGTGDLADALIRLAMFHGIEVRYHVHEGAVAAKPWAPYETATLQTAAKYSDVRAYVTATLNDFALYRNDLETAYRLYGSDRSPVIFSFDDAD